MFLYIILFIAVKSQTYGKHLKFLNPSSFDIPKGTKNHIKHCYPQGVAIAKAGSTGDAWYANWKSLSL